MRKQFHTLAVATALLSALAAAPASAVSYTFSGQLDDGPLAGATFTGSFDFDDAPVVPGFEGDIPLTGFSLLLAGETYSLASADAAPAAVFYDGAFLGLSYVDADAADPALRPHIAFVPGFLSLAEAYVGYQLSTDPGAAGAGFGSYSVAVVPEPASLALLLAGLGVVGWRLRQRG